MRFWKLWVFRAILPYALLIGLSCIQIFGLLFLFGESMVIHAIGPHMWSILPNLIIFALIVDILSKRLPRAFWVVPILVYGAYYALYVSEAMKINAEEQKFQNTNPKLIVKYDPSKHAVVNQKQGSLGKYYKIPVIYDRNPNVEAALSYRLASPKLCEAVRNLKVKNMQTLGFEWEDFKHFHKWDYHFASNACQISSAEIIPVNKSIVKVVMEKEDNLKKNDYNLINKTTYSFYIDGIEAGTFIAAKSFRLSIFPAGFAGCSVTSLSPSLHCYANLYREPKELNTYPDGIDFDPDIANPIAVMLDLKKYEKFDIKNFSDYTETTQYINRFLEDKQNEKTARDGH